jgi:hypothetical protein
LADFFWLTKPVLAQSSVPGDPSSDTSLNDPNSSDFSSDIFSSDFSTDTSSSSSSDSSSSASASTSTDTTSVDTTTTPTTTVADTQTGPSTVVVFWLAFLASFGLLMLIRKFLMRKEDHYDYF